MADIFVRCPSTGAAVTTGLRTEWVLLQTLPRIPIPLRCHACGQMHKWHPQDAWIDSSTSRAHLNRAGVAPLVDDCEALVESARGRGA